ncbi:MAG: hypothetical protein QOJ81_758 [Chloroflexota bacterium]|jgi:hypothetical protein|nr:hypothetical protein [Chloroflexota bacterium]
MIVMTPPPVIHVRAVHGQTIASVLREGVVIRLDVNSKRIVAVVSDLQCQGQSAGGWDRVVKRRRTRPHVRVNNINARRSLRRSASARCKVTIVGYDRRLRRPVAWDSARLRISN